jgi:hypothetical protein
MKPLSPCRFYLRALKSLVVLGHIMNMLVFFLQFSHDKLGMPFSEDIAHLQNDCLKDLVR